VQTAYTTTSRQYYGLLKVVRTTDGRILFPFVGAPIIGPFQTKYEARSAAKAFADRIIAGDLHNPEL
jgi:hypothetical protein